MKRLKFIVYFAATAFLMALPVIWIVAGLAADLKQFHPVAGWVVWVGSAAALMVLIMPVIQFLRLPTMPVAELWENGAGEKGIDEWVATADLLIRTSDDSGATAKLRRIKCDIPNDLPSAVRDEIDRRKTRAKELRYGTVRQAALLAVLSPHRQMDMLILLWLNLRQVFLLGRCFGFKPSPRGIFQLYTGVFGAALLIEAIDEVSEQAVAEGVARLSGGVPFVRETTAFAYEGIRAAAYVGFIGLLADYLLRHELKRPGTHERTDLRRQAWKNALGALGDIQSSIGSTATTATTPLP
jgi:hypothetical protein